ncbi:MAG: hypothetical protein OCC45_10850 [Desulfotalea sp.]
MITDAEIESAKKKTTYVLDSQLHQHNDCIRIAYEWLDAQKKTKGVSSKANTSKHLIEKWAGRYVSTSDVCVAAELHPDIHGRYPYFNISRRLTEPSVERLSRISEAMTHHYHDDHKSTHYKCHE